MAGWSLGRFPSWPKCAGDVGVKTLEGGSPRPSGFLRTGEWWPPLGEWWPALGENPLAWAGEREERTGERGGVRMGER